jgi:hypothetical protein
MQGRRGAPLIFTTDNQTNDAVRYDQR